MATLYLMIGLPGSGKSTVSKEIAAEFNAVVHSSDELRKEMFGSYECFEKNFQVFMELHRRINRDLKNGKNVVYDATNLRANLRKKYMEGLSKEVEVVAVIVNPSVEVCIERDSKRDRRVGEDVIRKMANGFTLPQEYENFKEIIVKE